MCLISGSNSPKVAERNIICYKLLINHNNRVYETPYMRHKCCIGSVIYNSLPIDAAKSYFPDTIVKGEGVHAFTHIAELLSYLRSDYVIARCLILKGTKYYKGSNGDIASEKMIVVSIISEEEASKILKEEYHKIF